MEIKKRKRERGGERKRKWIKTKRKKELNGNEK